MYDAQALVSAVRLACGNPDVLEVTDEEILLAAQHVLDEIVVSYKLPTQAGVEQLTCTAGNGSINLPPEVAHVRSAAIDGAMLVEITFDHYVRQRYVAGEGQPRFFCQVASGDPDAPVALALLPVPDQDYQVELHVYRRHPQLVVSPSPTPIYLHPAWISYLEFATARRILSALERVVEQQAQIADESLMAAKAAAYTSHRSFTPRRIRSLLRRRRG